MVPVKTLTLSIHPDDQRRPEVITFIRSLFPDIAGVEFRTDDKCGRPRALGLTPADQISELLAIDAALLKRFPV